MGGLATAKLLTALPCRHPLAPQAMLGFVAAMGAELASGQPVWEQLWAAKLPILATIIVFYIATIVPLRRGVDPNLSIGIW